ncbi:MAG: zinc ABC transporter substrate-binding protein [Burkholderiaceae bacterium]
MLGFMTRALSVTRAGARVIAVSTLPGIEALPLREGGRFGSHDDHHHGERQIDPHLWLDPHNARVIAHELAAALARLDPPNTARYQSNATAFERRIDALDKTLASRLAPLRARPFLVFHDAYQYLEHRYGLSVAGAVTLGPEREPGARRLHDLRETAISLGVRCLFTEPQMRPAIARVLTENTSIRIGELDPIGVAAPAGADHYPAMLSRLAEQLIACLGD